MKELQPGFFQDEELVEYSGLFWNQLYQMRWTIFLPLYGWTKTNLLENVSRQFDEAAAVSIC